MSSALWLGCVLGAFTPVATAEPVQPQGYEIDVPTLGLRFTTPTDWVLAKESTRYELVLHGDAKKKSPLLRIRSFTGRLSAEDRLSSMKRELPEGESQAKFVSTDKWSAGGRFYVTAHASFTSGTKEWHARFTVVDQPKKLQHGFWVYGKKKDLDKHWPALQASIASAKVIASVGSSKQEAEETPKEKTNSPAVFADKETGLQLASWPAGFALDASTEKLLSKTGLVLRPLDERAHSSTMFRVKAEAKQPEGAASALAATLATELKGNADAKGLREVPLRIGGQSGFMVRWTEATKGDESFLHEVYLFQSGATLFRVDFEALESWARVRSRRTLVKDFIAGVAVK